MEIKIDIKKKHFWILTLLVVGIGIVVAYGTNNPSQFGHTSGEIEVNYGGSTMNLQQALNAVELAVQTSASGPLVATGSYAGDGSSQRFIHVDGMSSIPSMVWVASDSQWDPPIYRIGDGRVHADIDGSNDNYKWVSASLANSLKGVKQGSQYGFYVTNTNLGGPAGEQFTTNTNSRTYRYFVISSAISTIVAP